MEKQILKKEKNEISTGTLKKILVGEIGLACAIIVFFVGYKMIRAKEPMPIVNNGAVTGDATVDSSEMLANADAALSQAYANLIVGDFVTEAGEKYSFSSDGTFTGFLNSENSEAVGTYTVQTDGTDNIVTILVNSESKKYSFKFTSDGYVELTDLQTNEKKQLMDR